MKHEHNKNRKRKERVGKRGELTSSACYFFCCLSFAMTWERRERERERERGGIEGGERTERGREGHGWR
jgi:hypothetical protein